MRSLCIMSLPPSYTEGSCCSHMKCRSSSSLWSMLTSVQLMIMNGWRQVQNGWATWIYTGWGIGTNLCFTTVRVWACVCVLPGRRVCPCWGWASCPPWGCCWSSPQSYLGWAQTLGCRVDRRRQWWSWPLCKCLSVIKKSSEIVCNKPTYESESHCCSGCVLALFIIGTSWPQHNRHPVHALLCLCTAKLHSSLCGFHTVATSKYRMMCSCTSNQRTQSLWECAGGVLWYLTGAELNALRSIKAWPNFPF